MRKIARGGDLADGMRITNECTENDVGGIRAAKIVIVRMVYSFLPTYITLVETDGFSSRGTNSRAGLIS